MTEEPTVSERSYDLWQAWSPSREAIAFSSESREDVERWLRRLLRPDNDYCLRRQPVRSRSETWWDEPETVPWHAPCRWEGAVGDTDEQMRCSTHDWQHRRGEPVPPEFWRPSAKAGTADLTGGL